MTMLEDLREVVKFIEDYGLSSDSAWETVKFIRIHAEQIERDARDAARYRWLRDNGERMIGEDRGCGPEWTYGEDLDKAIDAAMHKEGE